MSTVVDAAVGILNRPGPLAQLAANLARRERVGVNIDVGVALLQGFEERWEIVANYILRVGVKLERADAAAHVKDNRAIGPGWRQMDVCPSHIGHTVDAGDGQSRSVFTEITHAVPDQGLITRGHLVVADEVSVQLVRMDGMDGILVFNKTCGISSHDAVQQLRRLTGIKRIGHLGTLDPIGTGVLPMLVGRTTRLARFFLRHERTYEAVIRFGLATDSYDRSGEPTTEARNVKLDSAQIEAVLPEFRGELMQAPPPVSAKKIDGVPAYKLARQKKPVKLDPVEIHVYEFALLDVTGERATVRVRCSPGTYVRSLAHDLGRRLEVGAHVEQLRRTAMGEFTLDMAHSLEQLDDLKRKGRLEETLTPPQRLLPEMPAERVDAITAARITHGRDFRVSPFGNRRPAKLVKAIAPDGSLLAIAEARLPLLYHPIVVL